VSKSQFPWCIALTLLLCSACSPRHLIIQGVAAEMVSQGEMVESDMALARDASAFYLKFSESLLQQIPEDGALAATVSAGFTQYAFAFVQLEADRIEGKDAKAAQKMRDRARLLYQRANRHAMTALERQLPGFGSALAANNGVTLPRLQQNQISVAYWAAASWAAQIALSKDDPETVADLPVVVRLATLVWVTQPDFGNGSIATLMGSLEAARPSGNQQKAATYFDHAIETGKGQNAGAYVAKAESIALPAGDRQAFETLLRQALAAGTVPRNLQNAVMRERALWLLEVSEDLF
jgi:hypothetical protein